MSALAVHNLCKYFGERLLFEGVSFELPEKTRIGLVGINGCGKTTLMRIIAGQEECDGGSVSLSRETVLGVMEQFSSYDPERDLLSETMTVFAHFMNMEAEMEDVRRKLEESEGDLTKLVNRQHELSEAYQQGGGLTYRRRTESTLRGIGFSAQDLALPMRALSGGQKSKAQMAKLLLSGSNVLLLDEPTNHLDIASVEWLENHLAAYSGAIIVISHDRYFLDKVTNRTIELENGKLTEYNGGYTRFLQLKAEARAQQERLHANQQKEIQRVEGIIKEYRRWNKEKSIKRAESREKQLAKMKASAVQLERQPDKIHFSLAAGQRGGDDVLQLSDISKSFSEPLFSHLNLTLRSGDKVFLIGPNGIGKSTLFRIIMGELEPDEGEVLFGTGIIPGYYDQAQSGLNPANTILSEVWNTFPRMEQTQVRNALAAFLFRGEDVEKSISALSGGERARVALLKLMLSKANLLLLDEPTNHLDTPSREALEEALEQYDGSMIIISHDRYLINRLAQRIYAMDGSTTTEYIGNYNDYVAKLQAQDADGADTPAAPSTPAEPKKKAPTDYAQRKERERAIRQQKGKIGRMEERVAELEQSIEELEQQLATDDVAMDYVKSMELARQLEDTRVSLDIAMREWETLNKQLEKMEREA